MKKTPKFFFKKIMKNEKKYAHTKKIPKSEFRAFQSKVIFFVFLDSQIDIIKLDIKSMSIFRFCIEELEKICY